MSSGIEEVGYVQWDLLGYLILAWTVVYCVIWKGLHNSGKVRLLDHIQSIAQTKVLEMCNLEVNLHTTHCVCFTISMLQSYDSHI